MNGLYDVDVCSPIIASVDASRLKPVQQDGIDKRAACTVDSYINPIRVASVNTGIAASKASEIDRVFAVPLDGTNPQFAIRN